MLYVFASFVVGGVTCAQSCVYVCVCIRVICDKAVLKCVLCLRVLFGY